MLGAAKIAGVPCGTEFAPKDWIAATVGRLWPEKRLSAIMPLKGDASTRRFWRVALEAGSGPETAIAIELGPDDLPLYARVLKLLPESLPEPPWLNLHRFLTRIGVAVPAIYEAEIDARMLLVEDIGTTPLFEAAERGDADDLYRLAIDELLLIHTLGTSTLDDNCVAARIAYDQRLFRWELEQFVQAGMSEITPSANRSALAGELDDIAMRLDRYPRVFSHRDYHGHNLFLQNEGRGHPRLRVIDFQDALMAPAAQDLAVLLTTRDASRLINRRTEQRLLDYYYAGLIRGKAPRLPFDQFRESYRLCVLQHALKVIGRFIVLEHEGKSGYRAYIPYALAQARRMLLPGEFPNLQTVLASAQ